MYQKCLLVDKSPLSGNAADKNTICQVRDHLTIVKVKRNIQYTGINRQRNSSLLICCLKLEKDRKMEGMKDDV